VLASRHPDVITTEQRKDQRGQRIYADVMRNGYAQLVVASYSVRARPGATVAMPLSWPEVEQPGLDPARFTLATVRDRRVDGADPWAGFARRARGLARASQRLDELAS
jgi:bifunctional non-homologous end joining protein LigD